MNLVELRLSPTIWKTKSRKEALPLPSEENSSCSIFLRKLNETGNDIELKTLHINSHTHEISCIHCKKAIYAGIFL